MIQKVLLILLTFFMTGIVSAAEESAPAPYDVITPQPTASGDRIEVIEFFWYGCPHCFQLEPYLEKWLAARPDDVEFRRMPAILGDRWIHYARVYFAAELIGAVDKINRPLFDAIHEQRTPLDDADKLGNFLEKLGVDKDKFFEAYASEEVTTRLKNAYVMGQDYGLTGVPTIIINGKYRTSAWQAGSKKDSEKVKNEKLIQVMGELIEKERAAKKAAP